MVFHLILYDINKYGALVLAALTKLEEVDMNELTFLHLQHTVLQINICS